MDNTKSQNPRTLDRRSLLGGAAAALVIVQAGKAAAQTAQQPEAPQDILPDLTVQPKPIELNTPQKMRAFAVIDEIRRYGNSFYLHMSFPENHEEKKQYIDDIRNKVSPEDMDRYVSALEKAYKKTSRILEKGSAHLTEQDMKKFYKSLKSLAIEEQNIAATGGINTDMIDANIRRSSQDILIHTIIQMHNKGVFPMVTARSKEAFEEASLEFMRGRFEEIRQTAPDLNDFLTVQISKRLSCGVMLDRNGALHLYNATVPLVVSGTGNANQSEIRKFFGAYEAIGHNARIERAIVNRTINPRGAGHGRGPLDDVLPSPQGAKPRPFEATI